MAGEAPEGRQCPWGSGHWFPHGENRGTFLTKLLNFSASPKAQLLELRTDNYQLSDELRKNGVGEPRGSH